VFEQQRRRILGASMLACRGRVQKEGGVLHVIADEITDLSELLRSVGRRDEAFPVPLARADEVVRPGPSPARARPDRPAPQPVAQAPAIKVASRNFR
jgi:error-prone DNA polymerase